MLLKGDCIKVMKAMKPNSVDAIVTDPPYGLEFMGKEWDKLWDKREFGIDEYSKKSFTCSDGSTRKTNPVSRKLNNPNYKAGIEAQLWHSQWLIEAYRVLKPGGSMLVMGGTRTSHRLACAIEDSGFIIKDTLMWLYGSGFPKAQDLGKMIDKRAKAERKIIGKYKPPQDCPKNKWTDKNALYNKKTNHEIGFGGSNPENLSITAPSTDLAKHWDGFKVGGIKPAYEAIIWAVKPPEGSYVDNVLEWGVGAVNVDECRIGVESDDNNKRKATGEMGGSDSCFGVGNKHRPETLTKGRFPANIILSHHPECRQVGMKRIRGAWSNKGIIKSKSMFNANLGQNKPVYKDKYYDSKGYETVESWDCHPDCAVRLLDEQSGELKSGARKGGDDFKLGRYKDQKGHWGIKKGGTCESNSGGASRFFKHCNYGQEERKIQKPLGRFPANIILSHHPECVQVGMKRVKGANWKDSDKGNSIYGTKIKTDAPHYIDPKGYETVESWDCHPDCAVRLLDEQSGTLKSGQLLPHHKRFAGNKNCYGKATDVSCTYPQGGDSGGASRFFYCAKASRGERNAGLEELAEKNACHYNQSGRRYGGGNRKNWKDPYKKPQFQNNHPTVKPIKLFEWLIKLVTREGQTVLDPFIGSGTTIIAAHNTGRKCMGIEKEEEYIEIAKRRATHWRSRPRQLEII